VPGVRDHGGQLDGGTGQQCELVTDVMQPVNAGNQVKRPVGRPAGAQTNSTPGAGPGIASKASTTSTPTRSARPASPL